MNDAVTLSPSTALAVIPSTSLPTIIAADADDILGTLAREIAAFDADISTEKGREAIRSMAYRVARSKTKLDDIGKGLTEQARKTVDAVNSERRLLRERLEELQEKVRAPLTAWEDAEKQRVAAHEAALAELDGWATVPAGQSAAEIAARITELGAHDLLTRDWQEFAARAQRAATAAFNALKVARIDAEAREAEAAAAAARASLEAERKRLADEQAQRERDAEIAQQAAERARLEAEEKARAEREAAAKREQDALDRAAQLEAQRAQRLREEINRLECADRFPSDRPTSAAIQGRIDGIVGGFQSERFGEFATEAERARDAVLVRLRAMLAEAQGHEARQAEIAQQAIQREADERARLRREEQDRREKAEADRCAQDRSHRARINSEAAAVIQKVMEDAGLGSGAFPRFSQLIIIAIAKGEVPHVRIEY